MHSLRSAFIRLFLITNKESNIKICVCEIVPPSYYYNETNNLSGAASVIPDQIIMADGARAAASVVIIYLINYYEQQGIDYPRALLIRPGYNLYDEQFKGLGYKLDYANVPVKLSDDEKIEADKIVVSKELGIKIALSDFKEFIVFEETFNPLLTKYKNKLDTIV